MFFKNPEDGGGGKKCLKTCIAVATGWRSAGKQWSRLRWLAALHSKRGSLGGPEGKESPCSAGDLGSIPGSGRSPGEGYGYPLHILSWRIPWAEEPGGLQSIGSQRSQARLKRLSNSKSEKDMGPWEVNSHPRLPTAMRLHSRLEPSLSEPTERVGEFMRIVFNESARQYTCSKLRIKYVSPGHGLDPQESLHERGCDLQSRLASVRRD